MCHPHGICDVRTGSPLAPSDAKAIANVNTTPIAQKAMTAQASASAFAA
jgi:hypothetical protein